MHVGAESSPSGGTRAAASGGFRRYGPERPPGNRDPAGDGLEARPRWAALWGRTPRGPGPEKSKSRPQHASCPARVEGPKVPIRSPGARPRARASPQRAAVSGGASLHGPRRTERWGPWAARLEALRQLAGPVDEEPRRGFELVSGARRRRRAPWDRSACEASISGAVRETGSRPRRRGPRRAYWPDWRAGLRVRRSW
jgi:hypothetical protein